MNFGKLCALVWCAQFRQRPRLLPCLIVEHEGPYYILITCDPGIPEDFE